MLFENYAQGGSIRITLLFVFFLGGFDKAAYASELIYQPVNPSFGGNALNGSFLLNNAQAQNDIEDPSLSQANSLQASSLDRFTNALESRLLSQLISGIGEGNAGSISTQDFIVDIVDDSGELTVVITDRNTSETTEIVVNGLSSEN